MNHSAVTVRPDVRFHPEIPLVAFLGLVHSGVARLVPVLRGGRRVDDGRVHKRAFAHEQAPLFEVRVDGFENGRAQVVFLQKPPELEQGGGVGHGMGSKVDPEERAHGLAVVNGILKGFVGQTIPLLEEIQAQHALQPDGRTPAFALRITRSDYGEDSSHGTTSSVAARNFSRRVIFRFPANSSSENPA